VSPPPPAVFVVAYLGAGAFYALADITSAARSKQAFTWLTGIAVGVTLACTWAPVALATMSRFRRMDDSQAA
jgi:amino acid permease